MFFWYLFDGKRPAFYSKPSQLFHAQQTFTAHPPSCLGYKKKQNATIKKMTMKFYALPDRQRIPRPWSRQGGNGATKSPLGRKHNDA
jgi:hypothetical protein